MARHCPQCSATLNADGSCPDCTYGNRVTKSGAAADSDWWRCSDVKFGARCSKAGSLSHGTMGGGPWYCRDHFQGASKPSALSGPSGGFRSLRSALRVVDPEGVAERNAIQGEAVE